MNKSKLATQIKHQKQPNQFSCSAACVAMALDIPVEQVLSEMESMGIGIGEKGASVRQIVCYLTHKGISLQQNGIAPGIGILWNATYIVTVPSKGYVGKLHHVLLRTSDNGEHFVFDPQKGNVPDDLIYKEFSDLTMLDFCILDDFADILVNECAH